MTENMKKFLELLSQNKELEMKACSMDKEEIIAMARDLGVELTDADFARKTELDDNELDAVAGGGECFCALGGGGTEDLTRDCKVCACVLCGGGMKEDYFRCTCNFAGMGHE